MLDPNTPETTLLVVLSKNRFIRYRGFDPHQIMYVSAVQSTLIF